MVFSMPTNCRMCRWKGPRGRNPVMAPPFTSYSIYLWSAWRFARVLRTVIRTTYIHIYIVPIWTQRWWQSLCLSVVRMPCLARWGRTWVVISLCAYILTNNLEKIARLLNLQLQNSRGNYNAGVVVTSRVVKVLKTIFIPKTHYVGYSRRCKKLQRWRCNLRS
jgi:hypothetical protein